MTHERKRAIELLREIPDDKLIYIVQILQGVKGLSTESVTNKQAAFAELESLRKKVPDFDYKKELGQYREDRYEGLN